MQLKSRSEQELQFYLPETIWRFLAQVRTILARADVDGFTDHVLLSSESVDLCARALMELSGVSFARKVVSPTSRFFARC